MSLSLRIFFVAPFGLRHKTTVWARTLPMARELNRMGHNASILVPPWDSPADAGTQLELDGVRIEQVTLEGGIPGTCLRMFERIRSLAPDIVHIVKPRAHAGIVQWLLWYTRIVPGLSAKLLLDADDWERPWAAINHYPRLQAAFLQWQEEWGIRHADGVTAASRWLADKVRVATPSMPVCYLPNGVDQPSEEVIRSFSLHEPPRVLLLSRFVEVQAEWLQQFWHALRTQVDNAVLYVAGGALYPHGETTYLQALTRGSSSFSSPNIVWLGYVRYAELNQLFNDVDCAIFPSSDSPLHQAKCSVRLANVLQHGLPTIASAVGEQSSYGGEGASILVSPSATPAEFAGEVARVLQHEHLRESLGTNAVQRMASHYDWAIFGQQLAEFYHGLSQH